MISPPKTRGAMSSKTTAVPASDAAETSTGSRVDTRASSGATTAPAIGIATVSGSSEPSSATLTVFPPRRSPAEPPDPVGVEGAVVLGDADHDAEEHGRDGHADDDRGQAEVLQHRVG